MAAFVQREWEQGFGRLVAGSYPETNDKHQFPRFVSPCSQLKFSDS
jgi:hypothetical protein